MTTETELSQRRGLVGWIARHPRTSVAMFLLVFAGLSLLWLDHLSRNRVARRIEAIRRAGEPLTAEDLNERQTRIPDDENRTVALLRFAPAIEAIKLPDDLEVNLPIVGRALSPVMGEPLSEA